VSFKFIHASDLHLDTPFQGVKDVDDKLFEVLRDASVTAWERLVTTALDHKVDFVLLAGDIYDGRDRGLRARKRLLEGLRRLSDAGVSIYIVQGNHDPLDQGGLIPSDVSLENVHVFAPRQSNIYTLRTGSGEVVEIQGVSFASRSESEDLSGYLTPPSNDHYCIAVLHASLGTDKNHANYAPTTVSTLRSKGFDYVALGHIHKRQIVEESPYIVYSGNTQGLSLKPTEQGPKGCYLVEVEGDFRTNLRFIQLGPVVFEQIEVEIKEPCDTDTMTEAIALKVESQLIPRYQGDSTKAVVVRATVRAQWNLAVFDEEAVIEELKEYFLGASVPTAVFVTSIKRKESQEDDVGFPSLRGASLESYSILRERDPELNARALRSALLELEKLTLPQVQEEVNRIQGDDELLLDLEHSVTQNLRDLLLAVRGDQEIQ
jgi:DNA repair exonuclease SbcCD nuclease subunit